MKKIILLFFIPLFIFACARTDNKNVPAETTKIDKEVATFANFMQLGELQSKLHAISSNETPSVVFISTEKIVKQNYQSPFDFFFNNPGNGQNQREYKQQGLGSGVIYKQKNNEYYIITNNHVIEGADTIESTIDQSTIYEGEVMGADPAVDIAVVKIKTKDQLKVAQFGDSDGVKVGDFAIAIGNPFGLSGTMTFGIVSAIGRSSIQNGSLTLTDFIQTDAAINPGNSGGPLINIEGRVIGINTMIYSKSGGNVGIGFAVPVNVATNTADQIIETGKVEHGFLGIYFKAITEEDSELLGLGVKEGMLVNEVMNDGPAEKAGIKTGDVLLELNGDKLVKSTDLTVNIAQSPPGTIIVFTILRDNDILTKEVRLGTRDGNDGNKGGKIEPEKSETTKLEAYGLEVANLTPSLRKEKNLANNVDGVLIVGVSQNSRAFQAGIRADDIIYKVNNKKIKSIKELKKAVKDSSQSYFFINREGRSIIIVM